MTDIKIIETQTQKHIHRNNNTHTETHTHRETHTEFRMTNQVLSMWKIMSWSRKNCRIYDTLHFLSECGRQHERFLPILFLSFKVQPGEIYTCAMGIYPSVWQYGCPIDPVFFLCILYRIIDAMWNMRDIFTVFLWRSYIPLSASVQDDSKNWEWTFPTMINQRACDYPHRECSCFILLKG